MTFDESVDYLLSLGNEVLAMKLGLENISKLLAALGNPQDNYLKVQIAGTNGKGSTCAFLESICVKAGIKVGMTTSPHLISITERVRINGAEISGNDFARLATKVRQTGEKLVENFNSQNSEQSKIQNPESRIGLETVPTYFEQVTAIALTAFAERAVELAILETGLGGRFDATTAAKAEIAAITPIDLDHQEYLGETLAEIAAEKAAIIRENTKVVVAPQKREAEKVISDRCREVGVVPIQASEQITVKKQSRKRGFPFLTASFTTANSFYPDVIFGSDAMSGRHQIENASTAISLAEILGESDFCVSRDHILTGLKSAKHKGRLEFYKNILFDGAHNIAGAKVLREYLDEFVNQPITMIFGAMRGKNLTEISEILFPKAETLILTKPDNARSFETAEILKSVPNKNTKIFETPTVAQALAKAREMTAENGLILVTGSLYLIGEAQKILKNDAEI